MVDRLIVQEWLHKADEDFGFASTNLDDSNNKYVAQICFHFQQAAEKYLKAYIVAFDLEFKKIHDLTELLRICQKHNPAFSSLEEQCQFLTDFYIDTRYPVHWPSEVTREEAEQAEKYTEKIKEFTKALLILQMKK